MARELLIRFDRFLHIDKSGQAERRSAPSGVPYISRPRVSERNSRLNAHLNGTPIATEDEWPIETQQRGDVTEQLSRGRFVWKTNMQKGSDLLDRVNYLFI